MKKNIKAIFKVCVSIFLLGYILFINDISNIIEYFSSITLSIWLFVFLLTAFQVTLLTMRLALFFPNRSFFSLLHVRLLSTAYGLILPGQLAAEGVRAYLLGKDDHGYSHSSTATIMDKILGVIALLLFGVAGLLFTDVVARGVIYVFIFSGIALTATLFFLNFPFFHERIVLIISPLAAKKSIFGKGAKYLLQITEHWRMFSKNKILLTKNFIYALVFQLTSVVIGTVLTYGVGAGFHFLDWLWIHTVLAFALMIPISPGGIGVREGSLIGLLGTIGVQSEQALAVSFAFLALAIVQALAGIAIEIGGAFQKKKPRHMK